MLVGILSMIYVLKDLCFKMLIKLYQQQGYTTQSITKLVNTAIMPLIVVVTILLILTGLLALISNLFFFGQPYFILRITMNMISILMPFLYESNTWFLFYELLTCSIFFIYLYILSKDSCDDKVKFDIF
ncbi:hypothetical protein FC81_GL001316 [Liquorilactobacillus capillatus DSM 19910]|uniref:Uncharacterized protein n=2 Tax=Liquorilactobacillus capillatus TaxID=480931 RepID=A0A0R1LZV3_9LACO|nr:hypothetical protein FC81_GL001316 [Liquorilactobacillus capillatus DSM 19910]